jgi:AFG3 family protein
MLLPSLLLEKEVLFKDDLERLIGKRPYETLDVFEAEVAQVETTTVSKNTDADTPSVENTPV